MAKISGSHKALTQAELARQEQSRKEQQKQELIPLVARGSIKQADAADTLGITDRQIRRLVARYKEGGEEALVHQGRGKPSNHQPDSELRSIVMGHIRTKFLDSCPRLISEELKIMQDINIDVNPETVRRWMIKDGLWRPNDPVQVKHRQSRERRACRGELVQMDTSVHEWFGEGRGKQYMLGMIDDATSRIHARLYTADSARTNMEHLKSYMRLYGRPMALYVDRASFFIHNAPKGVTRGHDRAKPEEVQTQLQRAARDMGITMIYARSPQGKGRVERLFNTLQGKVIKMLGHRNIASLNEANDFLSGDFFTLWESRYTSKPALDDDLHRTIEGYDLDAILCEHEERVVTNDYTFQWEGWRYQIDPQDIVSSMRRGKVTIEVRHDDTLKVSYKGRYINIKRIKKVNR